MTGAGGREGGRAVGEDTAAWGQRLGLVAGITDRTVGSLGLWTDETVDAVMTRWREWRLGFHPAFPALQMAHQIHGTAVLWHEGVGEGWHIADGADGHATAQRGLMLAVTVADCVPIYLAAPEAGAVALLHAGWKGVANGMLKAGVSVFTNRLSASPLSFSAHFGVAICGNCYEVGPDVAEAVTGQPVPPGPRPHLDLRAVLATQARALGIADISQSPFCTRCQHDRFYSHRASAGARGRNVAFLGVPPTR